VVTGLARNSGEGCGYTFPSMALDSTVGIRCEGGVQHSRNCYFTFGLPRVLLEGGSGGIILRGAGRPLLATDHANVFGIPFANAEAGKITIEACRDEEVVARKNLYVSDDPITQPTEAVWLDQFGNSLNDVDKGVVWGAEVRGNWGDAQIFFVGATRFILLGRVAGQIAEIPDEGFPDWEPVWAIIRGRRNVAYFCGTGVRRWKEILWHGRKRTIAPAQMALLRIWERYQQVASRL
jgi:hypothetical protein